jgi:hypothetical protein
VDYASTVASIDAITRDSQGGNSTTAYLVGRTVSSGLNTAQGVIETVTGLEAMGGGAACVGLTAGACTPVGGAIAVVGAGAVVHGTATSIAGAGLFGDSATRLYAQSKVGARPSINEVKKHIGNAPGVGDFGDSGYMDWGSSSLDAYNRSKNVTRAEMDNMGFSRADAAWWKKLYQDESVRNSANKDLHDARIYLMEQVMALFD